MAKAKRSAGKRGGKGFSIEQAIKSGWDIALQNIPFFFIMFLILGLVYNVSNIVSIPLQVLMTSESSAVVLSSVVLFFVVLFAQAIVNMAMNLGMIKISLNFVDKKKALFKDLFSCFPLVVNSFINIIATSVLIGLGLVFCILPGIYLMIKLVFAQYFIVDKKAGPFEAIQLSFNATQGSEWMLILLWLAVCAINMLGVLCCCLGLFVTIPLSMIAMASVYRQLVKK